MRKFLFRLPRKLKKKIKHRFINEKHWLTDVTYVLVPPPKFITISIDIVDSKNRSTESLLDAGKSTERELSLQQLKKD